jgi:hypothetical protein
MRFATPADPHFLFLGSRDALSLPGMAASSHAFDEVLIEVWRQALVDRSNTVKIAGESLPVRKTASKRLVEVDFIFDDQPYRGIQQNPNTKSGWANLARKGAKVMQFLQAGKYVAVVVDGKVTYYCKTKS